MITRVLMICPDSQMIDRRVLQSAASLDAAGLRVTVVSGVECAREEHYRLGGVDVHRFVYDWEDPRLRMLKHLPKFLHRFIPHVHKVHRRWLQHLRRDPTWDHFVLRHLRQFPADLVYVHDLPFLKHGSRMASEWGVPLVFDAHEIYYEQETFSARSRRKLRRIESKYLPTVDLFITVNRFIADWFEARHRGIRCEVLHNSLPAFDPTDRAVARAALVQHTGFNTNQPILLFQGWLSAERNLRSMVAAMAHLPDELQLAVVGYGGHLDELREIAGGLAKPERVAFLGRLEQDELLRLTPGADLGVIPYLPIDLNHRLCSPNKFFEFVQCRVPIVAHTSPFFEDMERRLGVVATGDLRTPESFAAAITAVLSTPGALASMAEACDRHRNELAWEPEYEPIAQRCLELVNVPAKRPRRWWRRG